MKKLIILVLSACLLCPSCMTIAHIVSESSKDNINSETPYLHLRIVQTLDKGFAIAVTNQLDPVAFFSIDETFYDGKRYDGFYQFVDTYVYETKSEDVKTIPVYMLSSEYKKHGYSKELLDLYRIGNRISSGRMNQINKHKI